ncbi:insulin receptor substrate 2 isoform X2 [Euwallacea similis]|uniref:insulin receptor substrate 2 isoform X2 n=1 Tax=Euwallacea similis TaxID=1736056 RepID=UPI00344F13BB
MSFRSSGSHDSPLPSNGEIRRSGVLKKAKTSRKKYFVLREETSDALARLEYYDSEKKFKVGLPPKRAISLKTCFNINKKQDSKHKHVVALYTKDDCFGVAFESEEELKVWLKDFLTLQHGEEIEEGVILKPKFEFVWQVSLCDRSLGVGRTGLYRLCLTDKTITLLKIDEPIPSIIELSLSNVRSCGNLKNFFFLEVGRMSEIGAGEIWFEADDTIIALNIQTTISHRFKLAQERSKAAAAAGTVESNEPSDLQPKGRIRSASDTESSKTNSKKINHIMTSKQIPLHVSGVAMSIYNHILLRGPGKRRHSISGGGIGWSSGANHQRTQSLPLASPLGTVSPHVTNSTSDNTTTTTTTTNTIFLTNHQMATKKMQGAVGGGKCSFRERCDSMPSRPRTTSEGNHAIPSWGKPYAVPFRSHLRDASHSPPTGSPISPPSDSTGSSYSLADEYDGIHELEHQRMYSTMTPDEVIAEEDYPESPRANHGINYVSMTPQNIDYLDMRGPQGALNYTSNSLNMTSGTPSADSRYQDYPLDKVRSYVSPEDDDTRPCRAYSVGSKPPEAQLATTPENSRVRAFSVGSKTKKYFNRVLPPQHHVPGVKSNSAPLLGPNSRIGSSHGSINNPMDDLMEMDFSANANKGSKGGNSSCNHKNSSCNSAKGKFLGFLGQHFGFGGDHKKSALESFVETRPGLRALSGGNDIAPYVDMTQGQRLIATLESRGMSLQPMNQVNGAYLDMSGNNRPLAGHPFSHYLDMSGAQQEQQQQYVSNDHSSYLDMSGGGNSTQVKEDYMDMSGSSPKLPYSMDDYARQCGRFQGPTHNHRQDYLDMGRFRADSNSSTNSRGAVSPGALSNDQHNDYLDMSGRNRRTDSFGSHMSTSPPHFDNVSPKLSDHLPFGASRGGRSTIEGYVPMTPGDSSSIKHQRQNSTESADNEHGDYLNMSGMNVALSATKTDKTRSQPIAIQTVSGNTAVKNSSPISISSPLGRKPSPPTRGSPKMHLPLSPYSSLPRQKSPRKGSASQGGSSKDSSLSSSVTTTPSSSSTMFPMSLNSPQSPMIAGSKSATPTTHAPSAVKVPASVLNVQYKATGARKKASTDEYTMMDFETTSKSSPLEASRVEDSPYMNYCPPNNGAPSRLSELCCNETDDFSGDYAVMKPGVFPVKPTTLSRTKNSSPSGLTSPLANHLSSVGISDRQNMCFMPIREKDERMPSPKPGDVPDRLTQDDKTLETASMECEESRTYDRLKSPGGTLKISRPNSSNSDMINTQAQRPASTTGSEKGSSRPSSVCSEGLTSRLGSSSSVYSSSSSTSTVVGVPDSPSAHAEPQQQIVRLHYASLDLTDHGEDRSPRNSSETGLNECPATTFVYADIDFIRSEELSRAGSNNGTALNSSSGNSATVN